MGEVMMAPAPRPTRYEDGNRPIREKAPIWSILILIFVLVTILEDFQDGFPQKAQGGVVPTERKGKEREEKGGREKKAPPIWESILGRYQGKGMVQIEVQKSLRSELLDKETLYKGQIFLTRNKFKWETQEPDHSLVLFDGSFLWNIQFPSDDLLDKEIQVLKTKVNQKNKQQIFLLTLLHQKNIFQKLHLKRVKKGEFSHSSRNSDGGLDLSKKSGSGSDKVYHSREDSIDDSLIRWEGSLHSKDLSLDPLEITLDIKEKIIQSISYTDEMGNRSSFQFHKTLFYKEEKPKIFKYIHGVQGSKSKLEADQGLSSSPSPDPNLKKKSENPPSSIKDPEALRRMDLRDLFENWGGEIVSL